MYRIGPAPNEKDFESRVFRMLADEQGVHRAVSPPVAEDAAARYAGASHGVEGAGGGSFEGRLVEGLDSAEFVVGNDRGNVFGLGVGGSGGAEEGGVGVFGGGVGGVEGAPLDLGGWDEGSVDGCGGIEG